MKNPHVCLSLLLVVSMLLAGCSGGANQESTETKQTLLDKNLTDEELQKEEKRKEDFATSTPLNDTDMGLKNVKIDTAERTLSSEQKAVISYFDNDYFTATGVEFLRRYPQVFDGAQMEFPLCSVEKILSIEGNTYSMVVVAGQSGLYAPLTDIGMIVRGTCDSTLFMEGDSVRIKGRYQGVETVTIDGVTATLPVINAYYADMFEKEEFDYLNLKTIARAIFGDNVEVRKSVVGTEAFEDFADNIYVAELEDNSNSKFSKYFLYTWGGEIEVVPSDNSTIERHVEFSADFEHFFLFSYDHSLETMTLEYYDKDMNKLWKREFEEIAPTESDDDMTRIYDFTKNNIYCLVNNELYIINTETGEDTFSPKYVGKKTAVRKLSDGILLVSKDKSDGIMKLALDGNVIWKTNTAGNTVGTPIIQIVNDKIVVGVSMESKDASQFAEEHYVVLNNEDGSVIIDAITYN